MKAIISATLDDKYQFFLPITAWQWNKLGVNPVCLCRRALNITKENKQRYGLGLLDRARLVGETMFSNNIRCEMPTFSCSDEKEATYSQISRLFYAAFAGLPEEEHLIVSDIDMYLNTIPFYAEKFTIWGNDLVPAGQFPMCYARGTVKEWRELMNIGNKSFQECLDEIMNPIECENIRGNFWSLDQEILWNRTKEYAYVIGRAAPGTQFAANRIDRDDTAWRTHLNNFADAHLWRPGYTDENFSNIMELLTTQYPEENFQWLIDFRNQYIKLL